MKNKWALPGYEGGDSRADESKSKDGTQIFEKIFLQKFKERISKFITCFPLS